MSFNQFHSTRKTLSDDIYLTLKQQIVSLQLEPGEMIYESRIAEKFGVSRTPIREAIGRLHQEELINILPQRGACIAYFSEKKVREVQYIRETLEVQTFKIVAEQWNNDDYLYRKAESDILSLIEDQKEAIRKEDYIQFIELDANYHTRILELVDNQTLLQVLRLMRGHMNRMRYLELREGRHETESVKHHEKLLQYLKQNDVENTEKFLIFHLRFIVNDWKKIMSKYVDYFD